MSPKPSPTLTLADVRATKARQMRRLRKQSGAWLKSHGFGSPEGLVASLRRMAEADPARVAAFLSEAAKWQIKKG